MTMKLKVFGGLIFVLLLASCTGTPTSNDYYVSIQGSDSTGNGSNTKPWRTIQYALDHAIAYGTSNVRINLAKGFYNENIVIDHEVTIRGAGSSQTVTSSSNPLIPIQNVSVISKQSPPNVPWYEARSVYAVNAGEVHLEDLDIFGGMVAAEGSDFSMDNVIVYGVSGYNPDQGVYGVRIMNSSFSINTSRIQTGTNLLADLGLQIIGSSGFVNKSYLGNGFDHVIDIVSFPSWLPTPKDFNAYHLPIPNQIYITGVTIEGSSVYFADGIRISSPANVVIQDSKITRAAGGDPWNQGPSHQYPYAGIDLNTGLVGQENEMRRIEILNTQTSGFDVGIGIRFNGMELKVQGSTIQGLSYGVMSFFSNPPDNAGDPTVDFGGGPLGSKGKNTFSNQPKYAYYHNNAPYLVYACFNTWNVSSSQIDSLRIYDKLDAPKLGRVFWGCLSKGSTAIPPTAIPPTAPAGETSSGDSSLIGIPIQNANCRLGNSASMFDIADTLYGGEQYTPVGRGPDNLWLAFIGPVYGARCWVYVDNLTLLVNGEEKDPENIPEDFLPVIPYPPRPTPTFTPEPEESEPLEETPDLPACSDGIDNDGDGLIDMADGRCLTPDGDFEG